MGWKKNELGGKKQDFLRDRVGNSNFFGEIENLRSVFCGFIVLCDIIYMDLEIVYK